MTSDLVAFLRAQLDVDEQVARRASSPGLRGADRWVAGEANADGVRTEAGTPVTRFSWPYEMEHIAQHDPAHVLAEVATKRRIIDLLDPDAAHSVMTGQAHREDFRNGWQFAILDTLRLLALPFADREGYDESWRP